MFTDIGTPEEYLTGMQEQVTPVPSKKKKKSKSQKKQPEKMPLSNSEKNPVDYSRLWENDKVFGEKQKISELVGSSTVRTYFDGRLWMCTTYNSEEREKMRKISVLYGKMSQRRSSIAAS
ncbi:hypothetical protein RCL_jg7398.t1 [Rhizophagus clarus]|uniref:Uncharacterized protein n=1 Tax=Rhizophagus clarus TaxID=94130 RepID=A0A8H3L6Z7_9GLOM|nr:hypothetical protein RCL_jg7398.t1 [Rhizophagus clarus]